MKIAVLMLAVASVAMFGFGLSTTEWDVGVTRRKGVVKVKTYAGLRGLKGCRFPGKRCKSLSYAEVIKMLEDGVKSAKDIRERWRKSGMDKEKDKIWAKRIVNARNQLKRGQSWKRWGLALFVSMILALMTALGHAVWALVAPRLGPGRRAAGIGLQVASGVILAANVVFAALLINAFRFEGHATENDFGAGLYTFIFGCILMIVSTVLLRAGPNKGQPGQTGGEPTSG